MYKSEFKFSTIEEDVWKLLCCLDPNKAIGVDGISANLLRTAAPGISHSLISLFNNDIPVQCQFISVESCQRNESQHV